jgi:hypothetical protein
MFDYSIYEKHSRSHFYVENPKPKNSKEGIIYFNIILVNRILKISIYKDSSLEDLYIKIYNTVYPEFSIENINHVIPCKIPKLYNVCVVDKDETIVDVPLHRFITVSSYIQSKPTFFKNTSFFGKAIFKIYVIDEYALSNLKKNTSNTTTTNTNSYIKKYINCFTNSLR